jgi:hypothetical protein
MYTTLGLCLDQKSYKGMVSYIGGSKKHYHHRKFIARLAAIKSLAEALKFPCLPEGN